MLSTSGSSIPPRDSPAARRRLALVLTGICLLGLGLLLLFRALVEGSSEAELLILLPWAAVVSLHGLLGPIALWNAWRRPQSMLLVPVTLYFLLFAGTHLWMWADSVGLDQRARGEWLHLAHPEDAALHDALRRRGAEAVDSAMADGASLDRADAGGARPLHLAVEGGRLDALRSLLDAGANPDLLDASGDTPLLLAVRAADYDFLPPLLEAGADANRTDAAGNSAICITLGHVSDDVPGNAHAAALRTLLAHGGDPLLRCGSGLNALALAARQSWHEAIAAFVEAGHRTHVARPTGELALALRRAIQLGQVETVRALLSAGAPVTAVRNGLDPLADSLRSGDPALVGAVLEAGADPNGGNYLVRTLGDRDSPLELIRLLLAASADPDHRDNDGRTPLYQAAASGRAGAVELLLEAGANPNGASPRDGPLLTWALVQTRGERRTLARKLLAAGADPNRGREDGWSALMLASARGNTEEVRMLLDAGAEVDSPDARGQTALLHAISTPSGEPVVRLLIDAGADVNVTDARGRSALCAARAAQRERAAAWLRTAGADGSGCER